LFNELAFGKAAVCAKYLLKVLVYYILYGTKEGNRQLSVVCGLEISFPFFSGDMDWIPLQ